MIDIKIRNALPDFLQSVKLKYVLRGLTNFFTMHALICLLLVPLLMLTTAEINRLGHGETLQVLWDQLQYNLFSVIACSGLFVFAITLYFLCSPRRVYMVDFACYHPHEENAISKQELLDYAASTGLYNIESINFQRKMLERSGLGDFSYVSRATMTPPLNRSIKVARHEAATNMFSSLDELFSKTGVNPKDVKVLVVNCSLFNPTPSLSAMIVNRYKMRGDIKSINIGGMGCSAGLIAIDLAKDLLQVHRNSYAIVCSQEILARSPYFGNERSKLVTNCLFRMGGAAVLLSNKSSERRRAKYELMHTVRTHKGADDRCYQCVIEEEDDEGHVGVTLSKDLMSVAGDALKTNITTLGPLVLPMTEQIQFLVSLMARKVFNMNNKPYIPDFKTAFEHFCIHAGGRAVLDEIEQNLKLTQWHMEPSRMTLYRFGNTSSSSLWYELAYSEAKGRVQRGDRVWQIAFGSGFKCNSAVWRAMRTIQPPALNPWNDVIDKLPVKVTQCTLVQPPVPAKPAVSASS